MHPLSKTRTEWSPAFAYAIGLIATDGNLSIDGRHITFTSKDLQLIQTFKKCLGINVQTKKKTRSTEKVKRYFYVQFGDINFYRFLISIGITSHKSKTIGKIDIPKRFFFDFLRGCFDGDGCFYAYYDPRWRNSLMFYIVFVSASQQFINWIRKTLLQNLGIQGHTNYGGHHAVYQLKYAKRESMALLPKMYYSKTVPCLGRKYRKIMKYTRGW